MNNRKNSNTLSIIAICISVLSLAIGFAVFSNNLVINNNATVTPNQNNFKVALSKASNSILVGNDNKVEAVATYGDNDATPTGEGIIKEYSNGTSSIDIVSNFTDIGQTLTYTFYGVNTGDYVAYLNSIAYAGNITCTPAEANGGTKAMVDKACETIELSIEATSTGGNGDKTTVQIYNKNTSDQVFNPTTAHSINAKDGYDTIIVTVKYNGSTNAKDNYAKVDGNFNVNFGKITFNYASTDISR